MVKQVLTSLCACLLFASVAAAELPLGDFAPDVVTLVYDPADGSLFADMGGRSVSTFELKSESGIFNGQQPALVSPPFDVFTPEKLFFLKTEGLGDVQLGPVADPGLTLGFLSSDLSFAGSFLPSGAATGQLWAPEPSGNLLTLLGMIPVLCIGRARIARVA